MNPTATTSTTHAFVRDLNHEYERLHTRKEDAFWTAYMGNADDPTAARAELDRRDIELAEFLRSPERLAEVRREIERAENTLDGGDASTTPSAEDFTALNGWLATFEAHVIDSEEARALADEITALEGALAVKRGALQLSYNDENGRRVDAGVTKLGALLSTSSVESVRESAWQGLRAIEPFVLESGFIEVVRARNRLGRLLGAEDYYDWKVRRVEGVTKHDIFERLDDLERQTRDAGRAAIENLRERRGLSAALPWNLRFAVAGDLTKEQDPYFPFSRAVGRWARSFAALGIDYNGAALVLDLVDRKGKYENGFMHGPVPAWREDGHFRPARIQFTANAIPGQVGVGRRATETLFHEGGHAAHFANIDMPAPCFAQEFAPSSVAMAETQSMFLDSLLGDPDWQARYARTADGVAMPRELILKGIEIVQPMAAWNIRAMCSVCYAERAVYEIPDAELTPERILQELRAVEERLLFLDGGSPRPTLAVPHLLSGESSAYYHGYVLAEMAVQQTRAFFKERDGHLVDNPRIGLSLREHYWAPGNAHTFFDFVENLTGAPLTAKALADEVNRTDVEALAEARADLDNEPRIARFTGKIELNAQIRVVHGRDTIAELDGRGFTAFEQDFARWIESSERVARSPL
ncbi:MAG: M3 family metallopeptidase [Planctomycetota bacterium]|nr:M3 family metallopeptidase [Planctomycetota bacterium]